MTTKKTVVIIVAVLAAIVLLVTLFIGGVAGFIFYNIGKSEAAETAKSFLRTNEKLKAEIGEMRDFGYFVTGSINTRGAAGNAALSLKAVGARDSVNATVELVYRSERDWRVVEAYFDNDAGERIYLTKNFEEDETAPGGETDAVEGPISEGDEVSGEGEGDGEKGSDAVVAGEFDEADFAANVLQAGLPVLVVVGSPSSLDSNELEDTLDQLAPKYEERVGLVRYNLSEQPVVLQRFGVETVPTIILFKDGREQERRAGKITRQELAKFIDQRLE